MSEASASIVLSIEQGVATVLLNRPERRNAFDDGMIAQLRQHFLHLAQRDDIRAVVLTGAGEHFSGGADLHWMRRSVDFDFDDNLRDAQALAGMLQALHHLPMPTLAVVRGAAFGGAIGLIACCDIAIASDDALFALSEVKLGLVPATISPYVVRALGERACGRLFLTGERFNAVRAQELGLVSDVAAPDALSALRQTLLREIRSSGPEAARCAKRLLRQVASEPLDASLIQDTCQLIAEVRVSSEGQAGLAAFINREPAPWVDASPA